ncbi:amino acid adenylation domain-containing protein [Amycolatopsis sp. NPDC049252]|uniref:amino acid adenylation domain-containing protein n=1 Tax=Amycolatopsis sp. NPDC049252 TaxID=3363933 RepID=UPI003721F8A2
MTETPSGATALSPAKRALLARRLAGVPAGAGGIPRRPEGVPVPLSPVQHGLWVVDQFLVDNTSYAVHRDLWLRGHLDVRLLRACLDELVRRHEILRTTYAGETDPVQVVGPPRAATFAHVDVDGGQDRAVLLAERELRRPFDLEHGPVFRVTLFTVEPDEHLLVLAMHHIVSDGWSCGVLGRELAELYSAGVAGRSPVLPELPIQYADYAHWQAKRVTGALREAQLRYWQEALGAVRPVLQLPTDRPFPARPSHRADRVRHRLTAQRAAELREFARSQGVTLFTVLVAAFSVVLWRCSGQDTFAIGSLTSGRERAEAEHLLGLFSNTVAIPADVSGDPTVAELLGRTRRAVLGALDHQDVSFDDVVSVLRPPRETGRNPLFQVLCQFAEAGAEDWRLTGLEVELIDLPNEQGKVDLALFGIDRADGLDLEVEYASDVFDRVTADRFAQRVAAVLAGFAAGPDRRVGELDALSPDERFLVTAGWNDTDLAVPDVTLGELFEAAVARTPDAPAVVDVDGSVVSFTELNTRANRLAHRLRASGVGCESIVGVCVGSGVDVLVALLGVVKSGGAYLPLDPAHPVERLAFMTADTAAGVVVTERALTGTVSSFFDGGIVYVDGDESAGYPAVNPVRVNAPGNLVYVMYTSGSTGVPKGVMISHRGLVNYLWWAVEGYGLAGDRGAVFVGSVAFDLSVPNFFLPLIGGKDVTLLPDGDDALPALAKLLTGEHDFSLLKVTPGHLDVLRGLVGEDASVGSVRTFVVGADEVRPETVVAWQRVAPGARIIDEYGPTETVVGCSTYLIGDDFDPSVPVSIGRPIGNTRMYVLDDSLDVVPVGAVGELCIGGLGVARGYWGRPGLTAEKFVPDPVTGERMYRSGDRARFRADGNIEFLGRADDQVKIRGYRVEPGEVEARLLTHEAVSEAVVDARADATGRRRLVAYLVTDGGRAVDPGEVRDFVARALPEYMVPSAWLVLDKLPLTAAGKVDRRSLPAPDEVADATAAPRTGTERLLAGIWAQVLELPAVGVHDDFFALGGDSLIAIRVAAAARAGGLPVSVRQVFEERTVAALAEAVGRDEVAPAVAEQGPVTGDVPLTPILRWFTGTVGAPDHYNQAVVVECTPPVDAAVLAGALRAVVAHHDGLRTRLARHGDEWRATVRDEPGPGLIRVVDLAAVPAERRAAVREEVDTQVQAGLSLAEGRLVAAVLFTGAGDEPDRLLIAVHHIAVDAVSWGILLADLETACRQAEAREPIRLPAKTTSFRYWASRLAGYAASAEFAAEAGHWAEAARRPVVSLPVDHDLGPNAEASAASVDVEVSAELTEALLRQAPSAYRTETNDLLIAALARTLTDWAGGPVVVDLEGHGREPLFDDVDLSRTVGWFTTLRQVRLPDGDGDWDGLVKAVKEDLRSAPHHGIGQGLARHAGPDSGPAPEIAFNYLGRLDPTGTDSGRFQHWTEPFGPTRDPRSRRPHLIEINAIVRAGRLRMSWHYSTSRHSAATIERLATAFADHLGGLVTHCLSGAPRLAPGDVPLAGLDQAELDDLLGSLDVRARDVEDVYPLTPLQNGMLFNAVYDPTSRDYFEQNEYVLRGGLDIGAFVAAWRLVIGRHAVLRSRFAWEGLPHPVQIVLREHDATFDVRDWTEVAAAELPARLDELMRTDRADPFDLTSRCPYRFTIVKTAGDVTHVLWTFHHILLDAWSVSVVLDEAFTSYRAILAGRTPDLPAVVPYRHYLAWLGRQDSSAEEAFWRARLAGVTAPTVLPSGPVTDPGPGVGRVGRTLDEDLVRRLSAVSLRSGCTVGTTLQSAWALLLSRYTGENDVLFGTTVAGRSSDVAGIDGMVGMLINTLPTRVEIDPSLRVVDFLAAAHADQQALREREHCALTDIQHQTAIPVGTPLFDNVFIYENFTSDREPGAGLEIDTRGRMFEQTECPLIIDVGQHGTIDIVATYHRSRFDESTCTRLLGHFENLVRQLADHPETPLRQLELLSPDERFLVTEGWNDTDLAVPDVTLGELFEAAVARTPDVPAVVDVDGSVVSFAELNTRANRLAHRLRGLGVGCESVVAVCVGAGVDVLVALLGVVKSGGAYLPLDPAHPVERLAFMTADTGARIVVTEPALAELAGSVCGGLVVYVDDEPDRYPAVNPVRVNAPENLVYVMYTSGSTGVPKGVMVSHRGLVNYLWWAVEGYGLAGDRGGVLVGSVAFDLSVTNFFLPLIGGKDVTLLPAGEDALPALAKLLTGDQDFSVLKVAPAHLDALRDLVDGGTAVNSVRTIVTGGDLLPPETVSAWQRMAPAARIANEYGPTETVVGCSAYLIGDDFDPSVPFPIGRPFGNMRMYVLDDFLDVVPVGVVGELCIGGPGVARGYWGRPSLTAEKFVPDPVTGERMYRSGDLGRFRPDGNIEFAGRVDDQVKIRGYRVEPGEVEARLLTHEAVTAAVVDARPDAQGRHRLVAYVVPRKGAEADLAELREFAARALPEYMVPTAWMVLAEVPLTTAGKVNRRLLPEPGTRRPDAAGGPPPRTETERLLAATWARALGCDQVGAHDDFFELGGDSILAIQVVGRARQAGVPVTLRQVFELRTVARLAQAVSDGGPRAVPAEQGPSTGDLPLTPILCWFTEVHGGLDHYTQSILVESRSPVGPGVLSDALSALVEHHDALRTRLVHGRSGWTATIAPQHDADLLRVVELSGVPVGERDDRCRHAVSEAQSTLSLADGRLLAAVLFTGDDRHPDRLYLTVHHIAVDTVSWNILVEDLGTACEQLEASRTLRLPAKTTSFRHWARRLAEYQPAPHTHPTGGALPTDHERGAATEAGARTVAVALPADVTADLVGEVAAGGTPTHELLLTALARVLTEWSGADSVVVDVEGHGREPLYDDVDLSRTVGWFTTIRPVELRAGHDGPLPHLARVRAVLREEPDHGIGYGVARYLRRTVPGPLDPPGVCFNYGGRADLQRQEASRFVEVPVPLGADRAGSARRPYLLDVNAEIADGRLRVYWTYSAGRHRHETVQRLAERYLDEVASLVEACVLDRFPLSGLDAGALADACAPWSLGDVEDVHRLSPLQAGMLVQGLGAAAEDPYRIQWHYDIDGALDAESFGRAWQEVVDRHAMLRSRFAWEGLPHPVQIVHRTWPVTVERWDATTVPTEERGAWLNRLASDERADEIDLRAAPPIRLVLVRTGARRHRLIWTTHHIQLDHWSRILVENEVLARYQAVTRSAPPPEPAEPPVPFRDFIAWTTRTQGAPGYWRSAFEGFTRPVPAPGATRTGAPAGMGVTDAVLPVRLVDALRGAATGIGVTAGTIAQACWALLLATTTGYRDVAFDVTVAGRSAPVPGIGEIVGMLINTVPARIGIDPACPVGDWLRRVHDEQAKRYEHEHHSLVDIRRWAGLAGGSQVFATRFLFEGAGADPAPAPDGLVITPLDEVNGDIEHAAVCTVSPGEDWHVQLRYDRARYRPAGAGDLLSSYVTLLTAGATADPAAPLGTLVRLPEREQAAEPDVPAVPTRRGTAPATEEEAVLAGIWAQVLGVETVGVHDDFAALGGNSILVFPMVAQAQRAGIGITVRQALRLRTVAELAAAASSDDRSESGHPPLPPALLEFAATHDLRDGSARSVLVPWPAGGDPARLAGALAAVVGRHDALRSRPAETGGFWRLEVLEGRDFRPPEVIDATHAGPGNEVAGQLGAELAAGLDPVTGPLIGAALLAGDDGLRLLVAAHPSAVDDGSWPLLAAEITALVRGEALPPPTASLRHWARRLAEHAASAQFADQLVFWLADRPEPARLPAARPGTAEPGAVVSVRRELPASVVTGRPGHPPGEVLLAAVATALAGWTERADVLIDVAGPGRRTDLPDLDVSRTVGRLDTVHPVALSVSGRDPGTRLAVVAEQVRAEPYGGVGYGMARWLRPETAAVLGARPAPQVLFRHRVRPAGHEDGPEADGRLSHPVVVDTELAGDRLVLRWSAAAGVCDEATLRRVASHCAGELTAPAAGDPAAAPRGEAARLTAGLFPNAPALRTAMARHRVPGVGVALLTDGQVTAWGHGVTGGEHSVPVTADTLFPACSVSKHVTTLAVLRLVQEGVLDLDENVHRYLSSWRLPDDEPVTLRSLLSHTAGLAGGAREEYQPGEAVPSASGVLRRIVRERPAGSGFHYANAHFTVVQQVLEDVLGRPVTASLRSLVLDPLGMRHSGYEQDFDRTHTGGVASGHDQDGVPWPGGWRTTPEVAGSGLWSTPADLARCQLEVVGALTGGTTAFLSRELAELMITPVAGHYGLGTTTVLRDGSHWFGHPGDRRTHQSIAAFDLRSGAGLVVMANISGGAPFLADLVNGLRLELHYLIS